MPQRSEHTPSLEEITDPDGTYGQLLRQRLGGEDQLQKLVAHPDIPGFLRVNPLVTDRQTLCRELLRYEVETRPHPGVVHALEVLDDPQGAVGSTIHKFMGHYHPQSLGSMIPPLFLDAQPGESVLDLCASPGSKTTQIALAMKGRGELWANDKSGIRMNALAASIDAAGLSNVVMTCFPGERLPNVTAKRFDRVLCDAPCTGLGHKGNLVNGYERFVKRGHTPNSMHHIQYQLCVGALRMLRAGGRMVYSTCSLSVEEDEQVLQEVLRRFPVRVIEPQEIAGLKMQEGRTRVGHNKLDDQLRHARRILPWENPTEGFFAAILEKTESLSERHDRPVDVADDEFQPTREADHEEVREILGRIGEQWGLNGAAFQDWRYHLRKDGIFRVPPEIDGVWAKRNRAGMPLARRRGWEWKLSHTAAQVYGDQVTRRCVRLEEELLDELARTGWCDLPDTLGGDGGKYFVLRSEELGNVAVIRQHGEQLRWKRAVPWVFPA